jgi:hypothetical protein
MESLAQEEALISLLNDIRKKRDLRKQGYRNYAMGAMIGQRSAYLNFLAMVWQNIRYFPERSPSKPPVTDSKLRNMILLIAKIICEYTKAGVTSNFVNKISGGAPIELLTQEGR